MSMRDSLLELLKSDDLAFVKQGFFLHNSLEVPEFSDIEMVKFISCAYSAGIFVGFHSNFSELELFLLEEFDGVGFEGVISISYDREKFSEPWREVPKVLKKLSRLQNLNISKSDILELPDFVTEFTSLKGLNLSRTSIQYLPDSFGDLKRIKWIDLSESSILELPISFGDLVSLQRLNLRDTNLSELPNNFGSLANLQFLNLSGTNIAELPESCRNLKNLYQVDISRTKIKKVPNFLKNLPTLKRISFGDYHFGGPMLVRENGVWQKM